MKTFEIEKKKEGEEKKKIQSLAENQLGVHKLKRGHQCDIRVPTTR